MLACIGVSIADPTQSGRPAFDGMSAAQGDDMVTGDTGLCSIRSALKYAIDRFRTQPGNKANPLFREASKPLIIHIPLIEGNNAAPGEGEIASFHHVIFVAVTQGHKLRNVGRLIHSHAEFYIGRIITVSSPWK